MTRLYQDREVDGPEHSGRYFSQIFWGKSSFREMMFGNADLYCSNIPNDSFLNCFVLNQSCFWKKRKIHLSVHKTANATLPYFAVYVYAYIQSQ